VLTEVKHWWRRWTDDNRSQRREISAPRRACTRPGERSQWSFLKPEMNRSVWWYHTAGGTHDWRRSMERRQVMLRVGSHQTRTCKLRRSTLKSSSSKCVRNTCTGLSDTVSLLVGHWTCGRGFES